MITSRFNISEKYKYFFWTPERTGSNHCTDILEKLGFQSARINNGITEYFNHTFHNHFCQMIPNHQEYKFVVTTRNPYSMMISRTGVANNDVEDKQKDVEWKLENMTQNPNTQNCCNCYHERKPDYFIRLENLYNDWLKIPFVRTHKLVTSGELRVLCETRVNPQKNTEDVNYWKKYYNQRLADLVYYNFPHDFELFGYDKDSWKS